jgi:hypothetical protein
MGVAILDPTKQAGMACAAGFKCCLQAGQLCCCVPARLRSRQGVVHPEPCPAIDESKLVQIPMAEAPAELASASLSHLGLSAGENLKLCHGKEKVNLLLDLGP